MAAKKLVVVESPAKAKTINKYLGSNYVVEASVGHIKDLQKFRLGVDVDNNFEPKYVTVRGKGDIIKKLQQLSKVADEILIATDPDREGEAIAWHIAEIVKKKNKDANIHRVLFNEITKAGVKLGLDNKLEIDENLFMAQQARRVMDRLIGYQVSPFLSRAMLNKTTTALSAGRVQSVALRLICEREEEIDNFIPIEYWNIFADFKTDKDDIINSRLHSFKLKNISNPQGSANAATEEERKKIQENLNKLHYIKNKEQAKELVKLIKQQQFEIDSIDKKKTRRNPFPPFTTSSLQQEASKRLGFSNKKTMMIAQRLYEGVDIGKEGTTGLITYMRTDSVRISPEAQQAARKFIESEYGKDFLPASSPQYSAKGGKNIQDAHEAIRPSLVDYRPKDLKNKLSKDEFLLFELIYNRFLASQMKPAELEQTTINIKGGEFIFRATGSVILFKGFLAAYDDFDDNSAEDTDDEKSSKKGKLLPKGLEKSQQLDLNKVTDQQSFTKAPPRFTESSLVKELDEQGIGRPSTYAAIVSTLLDREYVILLKKSFTPTELGKDVNIILVRNFPELFNVDFTAEMEKELDTIAEGNIKYADMLKAFYAPFSKALKNAENSTDIPEIPCPECGAPMDIKVGRTGRFLGCSRYPDCKGTKPLPRPGKDEKEAKEPVIVEGLKCPECGDKMALREGRFGRFQGCVNYPKCKGILPISTNVECPKCHKGDLVEKYSPKSRKKFWSCSTYPKCDHITNYEPIDTACPSCGNYYLETRFKKGQDGWDKYITCPSCKEKFDAEVAEV